MLKEVMFQLFISYLKNYVLIKSDYKNKQSIFCHNENLVSGIHLVLVLK